MGSDERSTIFPVSLLLLLRDVNDFLRAYIYIYATRRQMYFLDHGSLPIFKVNYNYVQVDRNAVKLVSIINP